MLRTYKYILLINIILGAFNASGQYIDTVCVGTAGRGYHVFGLPGSTYTWNIPGGTPAPVTDNDTIFVNWGFVPGVYTISVVEKTSEGCLADMVVGDVMVTEAVTADAGPNENACTGVPYIISGSSALFYSSILWTNSGAGVLLNRNQLHPTYIPPAGFTGSEILTLRAVSIKPCTDTVTDTMRISVFPLPTASLSLNGRDTLCNGDTTWLRIDFTGQPPWSLTISDGTNTTTINNIYTTPYIAAFAPQVSSIYTISAVNDVHCSAVQSGLHGIVPVIVHPRPGAEFTWNFGSQNNEIQFHVDTTVVNMPAVGYMLLWNFGDGTYGYGPNPLHMYMASNTFIVTLSVTDTNGCTSEISHPVIVPDIPIAFYASTSPACYGTPVCFTDLSTAPANPFGYIKKWVWNFGDGSPEVIINFPDDPNICHSYAQTGTYAVKLTITANSGYTSYYISNQITLPLPVADFTSSGSCQSQSIQFTDTSDPNNGGGILSWQWNFGDPASGIENTSQLPDPVHIFNTGNTTYQVTLIIKNLNNCYDTVTIPIYISPLPPVEFTHDAACVSEVVHFNSDTGITPIDSIVNWSWNFGDGTTAVTNPVTANHTYSTTGTFLTSLTVTDHHGCSNTISHEITINPLPVAEFSWNTPVCSGSPVLFTDASAIPAGNSGFIVKWEWNFGDGTPVQTITLPASPNVMHTFPWGNAAFTVTLRVWSNDSCSGMISKTIQPTTGPVADFGVSSFTCENQPVQFTDLTQTGGSNILTRSWNFGDPLSGSNNTSLLPDPVHIFSASDVYNISLIVLNANGCADTVVKQVTIGQSPVAGFTAGTVCVNSPVAFTNTSVANSSAITAYDWNFGDGNYSSLQSPSHTYSTYGSFTVTLTVTNSAGCINSFSDQVIVNPLPLAAFTFSSANCIGEPILYTNVSTTVPGFAGSIVRWIWDFGDGTTINISAPAPPDIYHSFTGPANTYIVRLTVITSDSCQAYAEHTVTSASPPIASFSSTYNCENQPVEFKDISQANGGGNIVSRSWNFGDPASGINNVSVLQNPVHIFTGAGDFQVQLIVFNGSGCSDTVERSITMQPQPAADFTADSACHGNLTHFTDQSVSTGTISQWLWDFGDGTTSIASSPTHQYLTSGSFSVSLSVSTTDGCNGSVIKQVNVIPSPVAAFTYSPQTCAGDSVEFTDLSSAASGAIVTRTWDFGDGTILQVPGAVVKHKYQTANTYLVSLQIATTANCTDNASNTVVIQPAPVAGFSFPDEPCQDTQLQFTNQTLTNGGSAIVQWLWNFDDPLSGIENTSVLENPSHIFSQGGTYDVVLHATNSAGCSDSIVKPVSVKVSPQALFTSDLSCNNSPTHFTDGSATPSGTIITWLWNFGDPSSGINNTSNLQNPVHVYSTPGNFNVSLTVINSNYCTGDTTISVAVSTSPAAMFQYTGACFGAPTKFTDMSAAPGSEITSWSWDFGDGTGTSTQQNPLYTYNSPGTYYVKLKITNLNNCSDSITLAVIAAPAPVAGFNSISFYCPQGKVSFQDASVSLPAPIIQRTWIFETGYTSSLVNPEHVFSHTDSIYPVTLIVTNNNGCSDTVIKPVYVKPAFSFSFIADTVCLNTASHFTPLNTTPGDSIYNVEWDFGDPGSGINNTSNDYYATHVYSHAGEFRVKLTVANSDNCNGVIYKDVFVKAIPVSSFTFTVADDGTVTFNDESSAGSGTITSREWSFGDGSSIVMQSPGPGNISHTYNEGKYDVTLKVTNSPGCSAQFSLTVDVSYEVVAGFIHTDSLLCTLSPIVFCDTSKPLNNIRMWRWDFGDGTDTTYSAHQGCLVHRYSLPGTYLVKLIVSAASGGRIIDDSITRMITVHPSPATYAAISIDEACLGKMTSFMDMGPDNSAGTKWHWNFGDPGSGNSNESELRNPFHRYAASGHYEVSLFMINKFGCKDSVARTARVHAIPEAGFTSNVACSNNPTHFTDITLKGDTALQHWYWNFGDISTQQDTSFEQNPVYKYSKEGNYDVSMIVKDRNGCADTVDSVLSVYISPVSAFNISENMNGMPGKILLNNLSTGSKTYFWDFGNGVTSTDENPVITYSANGSYLISLIAYSPKECTDTTFYQYEMLFRGLYVPNAFVPCYGTEAGLFKPIGMNLKFYTVEVFDPWGHRVWNSDKLDADGRPAEGWDGKDNKGNLLPQGTYMWKISAMFMDGKIWEGSDIGRGEAKTIGTVSLIR